jgi:hypothetical protein
MGKYTVVDRRSLEAALREKDFGLSDLGSTKALGELSDSVGGMPAIAVGTLQNRTGRVVALECSLKQTRGHELAGMARGTALLTASEWAMLGRSVEVRPADRRPEIRVDGGEPRAMEEVFIERLERRAEGPHPFLDPKFPYRVKIMIKTAGRRLPVERKGVFRGNDMYVPLRKGEVYEIWVENNSGQPTMLRLLVDGLNTRPEDPKEKDMIVKGISEEEMWLAAQRVNLDEARPWYMRIEHKTVAIRGFFSSIDTGGKYNEFVVSDAPDSLEARRKFSDQIGMITAAFYSVKGGGTRAVHTIRGEERTGTVKRVKNVEVGNLRGVVHIRYAEPETIGVDMP